MALSYKQQLVFIDNKSSSVTVNIGDTIEIKGQESNIRDKNKIIGRVVDFNCRECPYTISVINKNYRYTFNLNDIESIEKLYWTPEMIEGITDEIQSKYSNIKLRFKGNKDWMIIYWDCDDEDKEDLTNDEFNDFTVAVSKYLSIEEIKSTLIILKYNEIMEEE